MGTKLPSLWNDLLGKLGITIGDFFLEQSIYQGVLAIVVKEYFECSSCKSTARCVQYTAFHQMKLMCSE